jgi:hypothetical protein
MVMLIYERAWEKLGTKGSLLNLMREISLVYGLPDITTLKRARQFKAMWATAIRALLKPNGVIYDVKYLLAKSEADGQL